LNIGTYSLNAKTSQISEIKLVINSIPDTENELFPRTFRLPYLILHTNITDIRNWSTLLVLGNCEPLRAHTGFGVCSEVALFRQRQGLYSNQVWLGLVVLNKDHFQWPYGDPIKAGCQQASLNQPHEYCVFICIPTVAFTQWSHMQINESSTNALYPCRQ